MQDFLFLCFFPLDHALSCIPHHYVLSAAYGVGRAEHGSFAACDRLHVCTVTKCTASKSCLVKVRKL
jgi:hypothetical protein